MTGDELELLQLDASTKQNEYYQHPPHQQQQLNINPNESSWTATATATNSAGYLLQFITAFATTG